MGRHPEHRAERVRVGGAGGGSKPGTASTTRHCCRRHPVPCDRWPTAEPTEGNVARPEHCGNPRVGRPEMTLELILGQSISRISRLTELNKSSRASSLARMKCETTTPILAESSICCENFSLLPRPREGVFTHWRGAGHLPEFQTTVRWLRPPYYLPPWYWTADQLLRSEAQSDRTTPLGGLYKLYGCTVWQMPWQGVCQHFKRLYDGRRPPYYLLPPWLAGPAGGELFWTRPLATIQTLPKWPQNRVRGPARTSTK